MPTVTFDTNPDAPTPQQQAAEAEALAQGEKIQQMQEDDKARLYDQVDSENQSADLIGGKFKSQEDLLKAYEELQKKLGQGDTEEGTEDASEGQEEATPQDYGNLSKAADEYAQGKGLSDETVKSLAEQLKSDPEKFIREYEAFYTQNASKYQQAQQLAQNEAAEIMAIAGGPDGYQEMVQWAAENLDRSEVEAFNSITDSGNAAAIRFAVSALKDRYKAAEGFEGQMVSGRASSNTGIKPYRSTAELARDIANPLYSSDPAFRADVEQRLSISKDLL
jgi:hypothetical protein